MKYIIASFLLLTLAACSESKDNKDKGVQTGGSTSEQSNAPVKNETNYGVCGNFTSTRTDLDGAWQMVQSQGEFQFLMTMEFNNGFVNLTNDCYFHGRSLRASASSPASYGLGRLEVFRAADNTEKIEEPGFHMNCNVSIRPMRVNYSFHGNCLVISQPGSSEEMVLTPR